MRCLEALIAAGVDLEATSEVWAKAIFTLYVLEPTSPGIPCLSETKDSARTCVSIPAQGAEDAGKTAMYLSLKDGMSEASIVLASAGE